MSTALILHQRSFFLIKTETITESHSCIKYTERKMTVECPALADIYTTQPLYLKLREHLRRRARDVARSGGTRISDVKYLTGEMHPGNLNKCYRQLMAVHR